MNEVYNEDRGFCGCLLDGRWLAVYCALFDTRMYLAEAWRLTRGLGLEGTFLG
jgi:hypothetical protein